MGKKMGMTPDIWE